MPVTGSGSAALRFCFEEIATQVDQPQSKRQALVAKKPWCKRKRTWVAGISTPIVIASLTAVIVPWEQKFAEPGPAGAPTRKASDAGGGVASHMSSAPQLPDIRVAVERDPDRVQSFSDMATQDYLIPKRRAIGDPPPRATLIDLDAARPGAWYFPKGIPSDSYSSGTSSPSLQASVG